MGADQVLNLRLTFLVFVFDFYFDSTQKLNSTLLSGLIIFQLFGSNSVHVLNQSIDIVIDVTIDKYLA